MRVGKCVGISYHPCLIIRARRSVPILAAWFPNPRRGEKFFAPTTATAATVHTAATRIQFIQFPVNRVVPDVFTDSAQFGFIADNVFPIISLPYIMNGCVVSHPFGYTDFETTNDGTDRFRRAR